MGERVTWDIAIRKRLTAHIKKLDTQYKSIVSMRVNEETGKAVVQFINRYGNEREEMFVI